MNKYFACGVFLALLASARAADLKGEWSFIDTRSGAYATLSMDDRVFVSSEIGKPATFCARESGLACFSSEIISFAVPNGPDEPDAWRHGDRVYCVVRRFPDASNDEEQGGAWLIFSRPGGRCDGGTAVDQVAIYSKTTGLRLIRTMLPAGGFHEFWAVDEIGFGVQVGQ